MMGEAAEAPPELSIEQHGPSQNGMLEELLDKVIDHLGAIGRKATTRSARAPTTVTARSGQPRRKPR